MFHLESKRNKAFLFVENQSGSLETVGWSDGESM